MWGFGTMLVNKKKDEVLSQYESIKEIVLS